MNKAKTISGFAKKFFLLVIVCLFAMTNVWAGSRPEAAGAARDPYNVDIYTFNSGTFTYIVGIAVAELMNEVHPWIRMVAVESPGAQPNELMMQDATDQQRRHTLYYGDGYNAYRGRGPFEGKPSQRSKIAFCYGLVLSGIVATNPNITRLQDFAGRSMAIRGGGSTTNPYWIAIFEEAGVRNITYERVDHTPGVEGVLSGSIDGYIAAFNSVTADLTRWNGNTAAIEFLARARNVNFIDMPQAEERIIRNTAGGPFQDFFNVVTSVPAGAVDPRQNRPWYASLANIILMADQDFPADIMYEIMKAVGENGEKLRSFHPQLAFLSPQTMAIYSYPGEFHSGSMRYFNEAGVRPVFLGDLGDIFR